ncbi:hypothetical protein ACQVP2_33045 [Methylobacterium aquaticum]|uniref:hypothetical protein n=1 Tax=Methylobacterium aquaticum TaxID=270351 RepID=UPI003D17F297
MNQTDESGTTPSRRLTGDELDGIAGGVASEQFVVQINGPSHLLTEKHVETPASPFNLAGEPSTLKIASSSIKLDTVVHDKNVHGNAMDNPLADKIAALTPEKRAAYDEYQVLMQKMLNSPNGGAVLLKPGEAINTNKTSRIDELRDIIGDMQLTPLYSYKVETGKFSKIKINDPVEVNEYGPIGRNLTGSQGSAQKTASY